MARTLRATHSWGGATGNDPGVAVIAATLTQAPVEVAVVNAAQYPPRWTYLGRMGIRFPTQGLSGVAQEVPIFRGGGTLIYPRGAVLSVGPPNVMRGYNLIFEPFDWVTQGTIEFYTDPALAYNGQANFGGA